ncbi:unnamed protein product [Dibothriocephalus latus]|uniref:Calponin-homology (CH) domain-containing protein n=1 Tax=Dibothriocephalus latus TaxID=60516 RepID=A0A3P7NPR7_DIBLA|nr:unnamed protein product [Dibothriocephalus latus]
MVSLISTRWIFCQIATLFPIDFKDIADNSDYDKSVHSDNGDKTIVVADEDHDDDENDDDDDDDEDCITRLSHGVILILLMGLLEGYFVPLHCYHPMPSTDAMRLTNINLAFDLIRAAELPEPMERPEDIAMGDSRAILRLLYSIYSRYQYEVGGRNPVDDLHELKEEGATADGQDEPPEAGLGPHQMGRTDVVAECA